VGNGEIKNSFLIRKGELKEKPKPGEVGRGGGE